MLTSSEVTAIILVNLLVECVCIDFLVFRTGLVGAVIGAASWSGSVECT